ncbi:Sodium-dependent glucose transporter 1 [Varanus komodoensis]|uniref:Major facilitator superfamily domain containing 4B n=1 Tax=Varanus komodoensis TaxID=61221 RepID=A0A8D2KU49_VARKO|nr:sodium-dependent glucose transporter 1 [Varanus komodoensis]KAF7253402.1 Sodium-dependent glucose transporter 1 [Varanus komodoensis]
MADAVERKKQVRFARLEEDEDDGGGGEGDEEEELVVAADASSKEPLRGSARLVSQPAVTVAEGSGRRSRAGGGVGAAKQQAVALKWCTSIALCAAFLGLGMAIAVLGPTFQDLATNVNKNVSQISYIFVGRSMGYFGGSLIGGILFDCMNAQLLLGLSMLGTALGLYAIPWCRQVLLLTAMMSVIGFAMGVLDTGGNVLALDTWGTEAGPHMQALHFSFALGAFVAPILAKMALGGSFIDPQAHPGGSDKNETSVNSLPAVTSLLKLHLNLNFMWSYVMIGTYLLLVALLFFLLYLRSTPVRDRSKLSVQKYQVVKYHHAVIILLAVFFFWYVGAEVTYGSYIFTYAKTYVGMKENEAAGLNSLFWGTFAACRGLAICFAACSYPGSMILLSIIGSTVSSLFLALFNTHAVSLWLGSAVYGASMATIFPSGISWVEQYITIQGKSAALFVMGAALGEMCIPAVVGLLQGYFPTHPVLLYAALGAAVMTAVLFPVMYKLATLPCDAKLKHVGDSELQEALLSSSHLEDEEDGREWNEVDFEVIEMNDTLHNSVIETSKMIQGESTGATSSHPPSGSLPFNTSPMLAIRSPRRKNSSKND